MTAYEIRITATGAEGEGFLLSDRDGLFRATTETIEAVRDTVLEKCGRLMSISEDEGISEVTASIYEVTSKGERVYIGTMFSQQAA